LALDESPVNRAIVEATKTICDAKGCETYAEGIETVQQLDMLRDIGITKGQGFLFSRAVPIGDFVGLLHNNNFSEVSKGSDSLSAWKHIFSNKDVVLKEHYSKRILL